MTDDLHRKAAELFEAVLDLAPDEREAYLERACAGDEALRSRIQSLLDVDARAEGFLQSPLRDASPTPAPDDPRRLLVGKQIGQYRVLEVIASGGMGTVYEAMQDKPRRRVALKVLKTGLASPRAMRRRYSIKSMVSLPVIFLVLKALKPR